MWLLDTSFLIDLLDERREAIALYDELAGDGFCSSVLCLWELWRGVVRLPLREARQPVLTLAERLEWLPLDREIALRAGELEPEMMRRGSAPSQSDLFIATTALERAAGVISNDAIFGAVPALVWRSSRG